MSLKEIPKQYLIILAIIAIFLLAVGVVLSGCISLGEKPVFFENDYVKFQVPSGINITDNSDNTFLSITLYEKEARIGGIAGFYYDNSANSYLPDLTYDALTKNAKEIQVSGKKAYEKTNPEKKLSYVFVPTSPNHSIMLAMYPGHEKEINIIKNSLVLKKEPPKANSLLLIGWN